MKELTSQEYWGNPDHAKVWIRQSDKCDMKHPSMKILAEDFKEHSKDFKSVLEVGAGNGRLIGMLSKKYKTKKFNSVDINQELSKHVEKTYQNVKSFVGDVTEKLPFKDNSFDIVYTFQVLQHICPQDINKALNELKRVAKKEIWFMEGWGDVDRWGCSNGHLRHEAGGGTFYWQMDRLINGVYEMKFVTGSQKEAVGTKMYKIKL